MIKINLALALAASLCILTHANAQTATSGASASPVATSNTGNQDVYQGITFTSPGESHQYIESSGTQTLKNVPSVSGPALTTSNDTCMGSSSGSLNGPGFGVSMGSTWSDANCKLLKNSRELWNMGMKAAAMALMCTDAANREALELTGFLCPQSAKSSPKVADAKPPASGNAENITDPYIRTRMGLPVLQARN